MIKPAKIVLITPITGVDRIILYYFFRFIQQSASGSIPDTMLVSFSQMDKVGGNVFNLLVGKNFFIKGGHDSQPVADLKTHQEFWERLVNNRRAKTGHSSGMTMPAVAVKHDTAILQRC